MADALEEDHCATCEELSRTTGAKISQENAQEQTSVTRGWATHSPWQCLPAYSRCCNKKLCDYGWKVLPHVPYSPDMSPPNFALFPKLKQPMHGWHFSSLEELSTDGTWAIRHMNKTDVFNGIIMLPKCWNSIIEKQGDYIEGLWMDNLEEIKVLVKTKIIFCAVLLKWPP